jgi:fructokinase
MDRLFGGIETGGTKFSCAIGKLSGEVLIKQEVPTGPPNETLSKVVDFFKNNSPVSSVGIGSFGPVDLNPDSPTYGHITNTPKKDWQYVDIKGSIARALNVDVKISTDANCAAIGEYLYGAGRGLNNFLYLTVGTGIGGAQLLNGKPPQVTSHPEMGHIFVPHDLDIDPFPGICPFHSDCFEGLASGLAMEKRAGTKAENVIDPYRWDLEVRYLGLGLTNLIHVLNPQKIILGGGVVKHGGLVDEVSLMAKELMNRYSVIPELVIGSDLSAVRGAIRLAAGNLG